MIYRLVCVGRKQNDPLLYRVQHYGQRLQHYADFSHICVHEGTLHEEAVRILRKLGQHPLVICLSEHGIQHSTFQLRDKLAHYRQNGQRDIAFVVGGAMGVHQQLIDRATQLWSLSQLTLPHRLAQVVLVEQLYRVHTLFQGCPYHH